MLLESLPLGSLVLVQRGVQALAGLGTMLFISHFLSGEEQGWYYTFLSLAALYTLVDLGLSVVLLPMFSKFFGSARLLPGGRIEGEGALVLGQLLGRVVRVYSILAVGFWVVVLPGGVFYFSRLSGISLAWLSPWLAIMTATTCLLMLMPFMTFLESGGHIRALSVMRLQQTLLGAGCCWVMLVMGQELWAAVAMQAVGVLVLAIWLCVCWPGLLSFACHNSGREIGWQREILPVQWRFGVSWACAYFSTQVYTPILMHTQGALVAGQMGLSLSIVTMISFIGQALIARRVPIMAQAAARRDFVALDSAFRRDFLFFIVCYGCGALAVVALKLALSGTIYAARVLPFWQLVGLLGAVFINQVVGVLATYLRSFLYEPLTKVNLIGTLMAVPLAVVAAYYSVGAVIAVLFAVALCFNLPWAVAIWRQERRLWQTKRA